MVTLALVTVVLEQGQELPVVVVASGKPEGPVPLGSPSLAGKPEEPVPLGSLSLAGKPEKPVPLGALSLVETGLVKLSEPSEQSVKQSAEWSAVVLEVLN